MKNLQCSICYKPADSGSACPACGGALIAVQPATPGRPAIYCPWCNARAGNASTYADRQTYHCPHCTKAFRLRHGTPIRSDGISTPARIMITIIFILLIFPLIFLLLGAL